MRKDERDTCGPGDAADDHLPDGVHVAVERVDVANEDVDGQRDRGDRPERNAIG